MCNSNALAEIQSKYQNCNLLMPAVTSVQINPFYKCTVSEVTADISESSGDIFKVGSTKTGEDGNGKAIYTDVFSLAKPFLMKLATTAGIQFHPEYTTVAKENANTYVGKAYGAVRLPDGSFKTHAETKRICLDDEEAKYRLEFMDKSIMGITDWKAAKDTEKMFKGHWENTDETKTYNGKEYTVKKFVIDDCDREKYIERSMLVNMTLLRKTASEKAQTGAILRAIRALLGIKGTYQISELKKPFAVPTVIFSPDYSDAHIRQAILQQGISSMGNMFGTAAVPPAMEQIAFSREAFGNAFNPDESLDNPAFAPDIPVDDGYEAGYQQSSAQEQQGVEMDERDRDDWYCEKCGEHINEKIWTYSVENFGTPLCHKCQKLVKEQGEAGYQCGECGASINEKVYEYSLKNYGRPMCMKCQKGARK